MKQEKQMVRIVVESWPDGEALDSTIIEVDAETPQISVRPTSRRQGCGMWSDESVMNAYKTPGVDFPRK